MQVIITATTDISHCISCKIHYQKEKRCFTKIQTLCGQLNIAFNVFITALFSSRVYLLVKILSVNCIVKNSIVLENNVIYEVRSESLFHKNTAEKALCVCLFTLKNGSERNFMSY